MLRHSRNLRSHLSRVGLNIRPLSFYALSVASQGVISDQSQSRQKNQKGKTYLAEEGRHRLHGLISESLIMRSSVKAPETNPMDFMWRITVPKFSINSGAAPDSNAF